MQPKYKFYLKKYLNNFLSIIPKISFLNNYYNKYLIIMYHRVVDDSDFSFFNDPNFGLAVTKSNFEDQINFLTNNFTITPINDLLCEKKDVSENLKIIITFDDGYRDNLTNALPILEKYSAPATIYISTRFIEGESWTWWYDLWKILKSTDQIKINHEYLQFASNINSVSKKIKAYNIISKVFKTLNYQDQLSLMKLIDPSFELRDTSKLFLNWDEVNILNINKFITIGAHTHSHISLKNLTDEESFNEIKKSKELIEKNINNQIFHFAYPYGKYSNFTTREERYIKDLGFKTGVTTVSKRSTKDLFKLPRIGIDNTSTIGNINSKLNGVEQMVRSLIKQ